MTFFGCRLDISTGKLNELIAIFNAWGDLMAAGLLALSIKRSDDAQPIAFEIEGEKMTFGIVKA